MKKIRYIQLFIVLLLILATFLLIVPNADAQTIPIRGNLQEDVQLPNTSSYNSNIDQLQILGNGFDLDLNDTFTIRIRSDETFSGTKRIEMGSVSFTELEDGLFEVNGFNDNNGFNLSSDQLHPDQTEYWEYSDGWLTLSVPTAEIDPSMTLAIRFFDEGTSSNSWRDALWYSNTLDTVFGYQTGAPRNAVKGFSFPLEPFPLDGVSNPSAYAMTFMIGSIPTVDNFTLEFPEDQQVLGSDFSQWRVSFTNATTSEEFIGRFFFIVDDTTADESYLFTSDLGVFETATSTQTYGVQKSLPFPTDGHVFSVVSGINWYLGGDPENEDNYITVGSDVSAFIISSTLGDGFFLPDGTFISAQEQDICGDYSFPADSICSGILKLFSPLPSSINQFSNIWEEIENKPPFGWFSPLNEDLDNIASSTPVESSPTWTQLADLSIFESLRSATTWIFWLFGALYIIRRLIKFDFHI